MVLIRRIFMLILLVLSVGSANAGAVSSVTITPTTVAGDVYIVSVADVPDASGIDFSVYYDVSTLTNPTVTSGTFAPGAMMVPVTSTSGVIRVVFISGAFKGTGQLATISFTKVGKLPGRLIDFKSDVYTTAGAQVAAQAIIGTATCTADQNLVDGVCVAKTPAASSADMSKTTDEALKQQQQQQSGSYLGTVTYSGDSPVQQNPQKEESQRENPRKVESENEVAQSTTPVTATESASSVLTDTVKKTKAISAKEALALLKAVEMPVQRFRAYTGARTVKGLVSLFDASAVSKAGVVQVPQIAVSDGKKRITVKLELAASGIVPNFSLRGANLKSIRPVTDKVWELDALPKKGKFDVHLSVLMGNERADIPLVVIPPLDASVNKETHGLSEEGVNTLLAKGESKGKLAYDLNGDGRQDFLDDYILVAHYLLKMQKQQKPAQQKNSVLPNAKP